MALLIILEGKLKAIETTKKRDLIYLILSFLIASFGMFLIYLVNGGIFGEYISMRSDFLTGYIPIIKNIARTIREGDNVFFSFSSCLGLNNFFYIANIILSPFNILYLIFFNCDDNVVTTIVVILKIGCVSASFNYFSNKLLKNQGFSSVIISCFYALCSYSIAYGMITIMWYDAMMILPLLIVAIVNCFKKGKRVQVVLLYFYLFISQFYIAYMVGFFTLVFVILYLIFIHEYKTTKHIKEFFNSFGNWVLCVIVAALLSSFIWVPTLFFILGNRAEDSSSVIPITASLLQVINSFFWGLGSGIMGNYGYLYCGIPVFVSLPLFFMNRNFKVKEKLFFSFLLGIFLLCMISTHLNLFLHVFDQPDFFLYRYSFVVIFVACAICSRYLGLIKEFSLKNVVYSVVPILLLYIFIQQTAPIWSIDASLYPHLNDNLGFIINSLFIFLWVIVFWIFTSKERFNKVLLSIISLMLLMVEIVSGSPRMIKLSLMKEDYYNWYESMGKFVSEIKESDPDLYRMVVTNNQVDNSDSYFSYNGITDFGDQEKMKIRRFLGNIGFGTSPRYIDESGYNDVSNMLLNIRYKIVFPYESIEFEENEDIGSGTYFKNDMVLNIGYLVEGESLICDTSDRNVFNNLNTITKTMSGIDKDCFVKVPEDKILLDYFGIKDEEKINYRKLTLEDEDGTVYITVLNDGFEEAYFQFEVPVSEFSTYDYYIVGARNNGCFSNVPASLSTSNRMYYNKEKDKFNIVIHGVEGVSPESIEYNSLNLYYLDKNALKEHFDSLSNGQLYVNEWHNGYINGNIHVEGKRRLLFTSIPYDPGWHVKINGEETQITTVFDGAFMGVLLPGEGDYNVEFEYEVPGLKIGVITSLLGILALLSIAFEKKLKKDSKH